MVNSPYYLEQGEADDWTAAKKRWYLAYMEFGHDKCGWKKL